jgi:hypothetical protein
VKKDWNHSKHGIIMITAIIPRLPARDLGETEKFYKEHLDFDTITKLDDYLVLSRNGIRTES